MYYYYVFLTIVLFLERCEHYVTWYYYVWCGGVCGVLVRLTGQVVHCLVRLAAGSLNWSVRQRGRAVPLINQ